MQKRWIIWSSHGNVISFQSQSCKYWVWVENGLKEPFLAVSDVSFQNSMGIPYWAILWDATPSLEAEWITCRKTAKWAWRFSCIFGYTSTYFWGQIEGTRAMTCYISSKRRATIKEVVLLLLSLLTGFEFFHSMYCEVRLSPAIDTCPTCLSRYRLLLQRTDGTFWGALGCGLLVSLLWCWPGIKMHLHCFDLFCWGLKEHINVQFWWPENWQSAGDVKDLRESLRSECRLPTSFVVHWISRLSDENCCQLVSRIAEASSGVWTRQQQLISNKLPHVPTDVSHRIYISHNCVYIKDKLSPFTEPNGCYCMFFQLIHFIVCRPMVHNRPISGVYIVSGASTSFSVNIGFPCLWVDSSKVIFLVNLLEFNANRSCKKRLDEATPTRKPCGIIVIGISQGAGVSW